MSNTSLLVPRTNLVIRRCERSQYLQSLKAREVRGIAKSRVCTLRHEILPKCVAIAVRETEVQACVPFVVSGIDVGASPKSELCYALKSILACDDEDGVPMLVSDICWDPTTVEQLLQIFGPAMTCETKDIGEIFFTVRRVCIGALGSALQIAGA